MSDAVELNFAEGLNFEEFTLINQMLEDPKNPPSVRELFNVTMADDMAARHLLLKQQMRGMPFYVPSPFGIVQAGRYRMHLEKLKAKLNGN